MWQCTAYAAGIARVAAAEHTQLLWHASSDTYILFLGERHKRCSNRAKRLEAVSHLLAEVHVSDNRPKDREVCVVVETRSAECHSIAHANVGMHAFKPWTHIGAVDRVRYIAADHRDTEIMAFIDSCKLARDLHTFQLSPQLLGLRLSTIAALRHRVALWPNTHASKPEVLRSIRRFEQELRRSVTLVPSLSTHADIGYLVELLDPRQTGGLLILAAGSAHTRVVSTVLQSAYGFTGTEGPWNLLPLTRCMQHSVRVLCGGRFALDLVPLLPRQLPRKRIRCAVQADVSQLVARLDAEVQEWAMPATGNGVMSKAEWLRVCAKRAIDIIVTCAEPPLHPRCQSLFAFHNALRVLRMGVGLLQAPHARQYDCAHNACRELANAVQQLYGTLKRAAAQHSLPSSSAGVSYIEENQCLPHTFWAALQHQPPAVIPTHWQHQVKALQSDVQSVKRKWHDAVDVSPQGKRRLVTRYLKE